ncbi:MAG: histidine kinase [Pseudomonadota bacterium]
MKRFGISTKNLSVGAMSFQLAFWLVVSLIDLGPEWHKYSSVREILEVVGLTVALQMAIAVVAVNLLVPRWLDHGQVLRFLIAFFAVLLAASQVNILVSYFYLEETYPTTYGAYYQTYLADVGLLERLGFSYLSKYILLSKLPHLASPAAVLLAVNYYRQQQALVELRERQRRAELDALKNQLNPHFIFNTLNNIYALAIQRSEMTAEAVARLSSILDYVLHRGSHALVSLRDEAEVLESYIALEQLRFGDRLTVSFVNKAPQGMKIPPLLFLTLLENAFKHGVAKSRHREQVDVCLQAQGDDLEFSVANTVPSEQETNRGSRSQTSIGLENLRRQLVLQFPGRHELTVRQSHGRYHATLTIQQPCQDDTPVSSLTMRASAAI